MRTAGAALALAAYSAPALAAVQWRGDFETGDLSQWSYELNPEGLSVVTDPVAEGSYALRAELTTERVWSNGIFRTELQHKPAADRVSEGAELFFGWSIYLPEALPNSDHQLGYFETGTTYNQVFSLHAQASNLGLYLNHDSPASPWNGADLLQPATWHRIVYQVKWSADNTIGSVSLWLDGVKLVDKLAGQTFVDDDPAVVQVGLLKNPQDPPATPVVLYLDAALEGDSYDDVSLGIPEGGVTPPAATTDTPATTSEVQPPAATTTVPVATETVPGAAATPATKADDGGCRMTAGPSSTGHGVWAFALALGWLARRRTRRAVRTSA